MILSDNTLATPSERLFMVLIDTLVVLNRYTVRIDTVDHDCVTSPPKAGGRAYGAGMGIKCHMLERQCGASWSLLLTERRHRRARQPI